MSARVVVTGSGAICAAGKSPEEIWDAVVDRPIRDPAHPAVGHLGLADVPGRRDPRIGSARPGGGPQDPQAAPAQRPPRAVRGRPGPRRCQDSSPTARRWNPAAAAAVNDRTGVYVGSGGGGYQNEYEFFPLLTTANGDLGTFGRELAATVNPMWLLRSMPNNVLCHIGIRYGLKGPNVCVTNHSVSGSLAVVEAAAALRAGEADRALAVGHDAPIEPQMVLYYHQLGLLSPDGLWPFDARRSGSLLGEGAAALVLETEAAAAARGARVLGEFLGSGCATDAEGLLAIRADGDGLAGAIVMALDDAEIRPAEVGMIVAHGSGTRPSDASEAAAIHRVFGATAPPVTAFKWAFGHPLAASGILDSRAGPGGSAPRRGSRRGDPARAGSRPREPPGVRRTTGPPQRCGAGPESRLRRVQHGAPPPSRSQ